jgi:hypothetical protein
MVNGSLAVSVCPARISAVRQDQDEVERSFRERGVLLDRHQPGAADPYQARGLDLRRDLRAVWLGGRTPPAGAVRDLLGHIGSITR